MTGTAVSQANPSTSPTASGEPPRRPPFGVGIRVLIALASLVAIVAGVRAAAGLVVPSLLSVFLAVVSGPALAWLRKRGISRPVALLVVLSVLAFGGIGLGILIAGTINRFVG